MTLSADQIYALLPAIYRTRDAAQGEPLKALIGVIAEQVGVLEQDLAGLQADQFIETCAPWVVPYIGDLIGWTPLLPGVPGAAGSRAEVANTIGYRRRKGTLIALEQLGADVTSRRVRAVEFFRRLAVDQSFRHLRLDSEGSIDLRDGLALGRLGGAFDTSNRTVDVRRIAPRVRTAPVPDTAALDIALHGPGRHNIPNIGAFVWRWEAFPVTDQPAFVVDARRFMASPLGADMPLFNMPATREPFDHLTGRADVPQQIGRREFDDDPASFYGADKGLLVTVDGTPLRLDQICVCNLSDATPAGDWQAAPTGKVAIDPVLGRIEFAADLAVPRTVLLSYCYGFPAEIGGGPYDRKARLALLPSQVTWQRVIGAGATNQFGQPLRLEEAVTAFNALPSGAVGLIVLNGFGVADINLTAANAIRIQPGSQLWIVAAEAGVRDWSPVRARYTLRGDIEVVGVAPPPGDTHPEGRVTFSGVLIAGQIRSSGQSLSIGLQDCTLVPGQRLTRNGLPVNRGAASLMVNTAGSDVTVDCCITGPLLIDAVASARITSSIVDATSRFLIAYAGDDGFGEGGSLHIEDSTVIGKVRAHEMPLASNTIFLAQRPVHDPWSAAVWSTRRQSGCVRFCFVPTDALTPRQYRCLPGDATLEDALAPKFVSLNYGRPSYALLSGDCPVAVWQGADDESQIGAYHLLFETQGIANLRTRFGEYLPFGLEAGIFLIPARPESSPLPAAPYGYGGLTASRRTADELALNWVAIGAALI